MLRGMGWKVDEGIGGFKKQVISTIDPVVRPKGLGLGAAKPKSNKVRSNRVMRYCILFCYFYRFNITIIHSFPLTRN